ncbi:DASS family sodium-coupled anion symporter [Clostridium sp. CTA-5]
MNNSEKKVKIKKQKSPFEIRMQFFGLPIALILFAIIFTMPTPNGLSYSGKMAMGVFLFALTLWITNSIPNYVTALLTIVLLPLTGAWNETQVMGVLGYEVIWLTFAAFIIASGMEKSGLAKRLALFLITKFGKSTNNILALLMATNFLIAFVVPSTTARAAMMFPIVMLVIEAFHVNLDDPKNNFGRLLALQGIQSNNLSTAAILTATSSQILAVSFIRDLSGHEISWGEWFMASAPITILTLIASFFIGKSLFKVNNKKITKEDMKKLTDQYKSLGKMSITEKKALVIFAFTVIMWALDKGQLRILGFRLSLVMVAILSAALFFMPYIGILKWKEAKISWNLLIFACGAYAGGVALNDTGVASWVLNSIFTSLGIENLSFYALFATIMFIASFSHLVFTSKTVRTIILIPTIIAIAKTSGYNPIALALPAALTIADTITLPPSSKVNLIYYNTGYFTVLQELTYGLLVLLVKWGILMVASFTWFKVLGIV